MASLGKVFRETSISTKILGMIVSAPDRQEASRRPGEEANSALIRTKLVP
jgi:hypothetical protein